MILPYRSATNSGLDQIEDLCPTHILAYAEFGNELPTGSRPRVPLNRYVKASFSIDKPRDVRIQPFLLICRTCHIVTALANHDHPTYIWAVSVKVVQERVVQDTTAVPAFGQVYRQRGFVHCLARDNPVLLRAQTIPSPYF